MKNFLFFVIGLILGAILYLGFMMHKNNTKTEMGFIPFDTPTECLQNVKQMRVVSPFSKGLVLATNGIDYNFVVYLIALDKKNEAKTNRGDTLKLDDKECYRQIGVYTYENNNKDIVTLPVINIMDI